MTPLVVIVGCQHPVGCVLPPDQPLSAMYGPHSPPGIQQFSLDKGKENRQPLPPIQRRSNTNHQFAHLPRHGLKPEGVPSQKPREKRRPIRPPISKWQIGLG